MSRVFFMKHALVCLAGSCLLFSEALAAAPSPISPAASQAALAAPSCGARIFVVMGLNQNYPQRENMRVPRGDFYIDGVMVTAVSKDPEIAALDIPAGTVSLSWVPSSYDDLTRRETKQNSLTLTLQDKATAFVALDWYDDAPNTKTVGYRTEVVETHDSKAFAGKRIAFRRPLKAPCAEGMTAAATPMTAPTLPTAPPQPLPALVPAPSIPVPPVPAPPPPVQRTPEPQPAPTPAPVSPPPATPAPPAPPAKPVPPAPPSAPAPAPRVDLPDVSDSFMASLHLYYVVSAKAGAPAYASPAAEGSPLYTFGEGTELKVVDVSADKRWLTVQIPNSKVTGYVSSSIVTSGVRAPK